MATSARSSLLTQAALAFGTFFLLAFLVRSGSKHTNLGASAIPIGESASITVDHASPLSIMLTYTIGKPRSIVDLSHTGNEPITLTVPALWELREIRNYPLTDVWSDEPVAGLRKLQVPRGATVSFITPDEVKHMTVRNPSKVPLQITWRRVDLTGNTTVEDATIVTDTPATF